MPSRASPCCAAASTSLLSASSSSPVCPSRCRTISHGCSHLLRGRRSSDTHPRTIGSVPRETDTFGSKQNSNLVLAGIGAFGTLAACHYLQRRVRRLQMSALSLRADIARPLACALHQRTHAAPIPP